MCFVVLTETPTNDKKTTDTHPHAVAVVLDLQELEAAFVGDDRHARRAGVERVLDHLLDRRDGALHDLAGGDAVHDGVVELDDRRRRRGRWGLWLLLHRGEAVPACLLGWC